jgi:hypothetical protein
MEPQQDNPSPSSERPSFFSVPPRLRFWGQVGQQFWAGGVCGIGIGLVLAAILVDLELITLEHDVWPLWLALGFWLVGTMLAQRAVRSKRQPETATPGAADAVKQP